MNKPLYNRVSCRSTKRNTNISSQPTQKPLISRGSSARSSRKIIKPNTPPKMTPPKITPPKKIEDMTINIDVNGSNIHDKKTCRSSRRGKKPTTEYIYNVVTKTPIGKEVTVPSSQYAFKCTESKTKIFKTKPKNKIKYMPYNPRKKYMFHMALDIYENNQSYYVNKIEKHPDLIQTYKIDIDKMEAWFYKIHEPKPIEADEIEEWEARNIFKQTHKYTSYFDKDLLIYIS